jgi:hypothetical protein
MKGAAQSRPKGVVVCGTPIRAGGAESPNMFRSDRDRAGAFEDLSAAVSSTVFLIPNDRAGTF